MISMIANSLASLMIPESEQATVAEVRLSVGSFRDGPPRWAPPARCAPPAREPPTPSQTSRARKPPPFPAVEQIGTGVRKDSHHLEVWRTQHAFWCGAVRLHQLDPAEAIWAAADTWSLETPQIVIIFVEVGMKRAAAATHTNASRRLYSVKSCPCSSAQKRMMRFFTGC